jgi:hypothetical protein
MKRMLITLIALMFAMPIFVKAGDLNSTGWRKNIVTSYCNEYDVMSGDGGQWVVEWGTPRETIRVALSRDGFDYTETDSTISWTQNSIYKCEIKFNQKQELSTIMCIITVPIKNGVEISQSLRKKLEAIYRISGKFKMIGSSSSYSWLDERCGRNPIYALMANTVIEGGSYMVTMITSRVGE